MITQPVEGTGVNVSVAVAVAVDVDVAVAVAVAVAVSVGVGIAEHPEMSCRQSSFPVKIKLRQNPWLCYAQPMDQLRICRDLAL